MNVNELRAQMVRKGMTQAQVAEQIGMTSKTFSLRLKSGKFYTDECEKLIKLLGITDTSIFFDRKVTPQVTDGNSQNPFGMGSS